MYSQLSTLVCVSCIDVSGFVVDTSDYHPFCFRGRLQSTVDCVSAPSLQVHANKFCVFFVSLYSKFTMAPCFSGVSAAFAVKLFKAWINERDINSVAASLRKVGMDNRLMVSV